ncbi:uncharacterized protein MELLADRAFT_32967 [Melampsora larici-populina 98AG31]|uniref:UDENN domain-containing protein n=1 Tax=Melampsora larici-populina (strain 98AG31 / pathotype 3-4-7) TaxID=747676 RepID=F4R6H2_MELLP|nr:uncharacterized protein MELLADRAFT_32967 [Melampsora larici-populina 98AG31]EGG11879.1 hypothetical protein MELLADRAFT_32967 [Melampsora larici-populina 98AG31]
MNGNTNGINSETNSPASNSILRSSRSASLSFEPFQSPRTPPSFIQDLSSSPPSNSSIGPHAAFVLLAEFDIDTGSGLKHQYPRPTGTSEHMLADLMLPDGAHDRTEDWTVFFLNQTPRLTIENDLSTSKEEILITDPDKPDESETHLSPKKSSILNDPSTPNLDSKKPDHDDDDDEKNDDLETNESKLLYVISLVRTKKDNTVRRGAICKAMAVCSPHPYIQIFKPILLLALEDYFVNPSIDCLAKLYDALNTMDISGMPRLSHFERMILRCSERPDMFEEKFSFPTLDSSEVSPHFASNRNSHANLGSLSSPPLPSSASMNKRLSGPLSPHPQPMPSSSSFILSNPLVSHALVSNPSSSSTAPKRPKDTHFYDTKINYSGKSIPVRIPLQTFPEEVGEYSLIQLVQTFSSPNALNYNGPLHPHLHTSGVLTHPIILLFNALVTQKRIMFLGHGLPAGVVAQMVLAACALGSGCGGVLEGYARRAFPYSNLTIYEDFKAVPGYIAGVTNPIFELHTEAWDVFCNIETGKITISKDITMSSQPMRSFSPIPPERSLTEMTLTTGVASTNLANSTTKSDSVDHSFMDDIISAITSHLGEPIIRARFTDYVSRFVRVASRWEEDHLGTSSIAPNTKLFTIPSTYLNTNTLEEKIEMLGSGPVFADEVLMKRELSANSARIEGWRETRSYQLHCQRRARGTNTNFGFDAHHQLSRLRMSQRISEVEVQAMHEVLVAKVQTHQEIIEILSYAPHYLGGLSPFTYGLFHSSEIIRSLCVEFIRRIESHPTGQKFFQGLNTFHKLAYQRLAHYMYKRISGSFLVNSNTNTNTNGNSNGVLSNYGSPNLLQQSQMGNGTGGGGNEYEVQDQSEVMEQSLFDKRHSGSYVIFED